MVLVLIQSSEDFGMWFCFEISVSFGPLARNSQTIITCQDHIRKYSSKPVITYSLHFYFYIFTPVILRTVRTFK
jgi:hypothetical protein